MAQNPRANELNSFQADCIAEENALHILRTTMEANLPRELIDAVVPLTKGSTGFVRSRTACVEFWRTVFVDLNASGRLYRLIRDILQTDHKLPFG